MITNENTPTIETERLILRKFTEHDADALFELLSDKDINTFLPWFPLKNINEANQFLQERFLAYYHKPSSYRYAICLKKNNQPIGYVWLSDTESHDFGYALKKEFWNLGIATEASKAVVEPKKKQLNFGHELGRKPPSFSLHEGLTFRFFSFSLPACTPATPGAPAATSAAPQFAAGNTCL